MKKTLTLLLFVSFFGHFANAQDLYDINTLRTISITFTEPKWDSILQEWHKQNLENRLPATLVMDGVTYDSVGVQYKGNITFFAQDVYNISKFALNIDMNYYLPNQTLLGYKKLRLGNAATDPTYVREALAVTIYQKYLPTYRSNFMKININGSYYGLFTNSENVDSKFLKTHFDTQSGTLIKCDPNKVDVSCTAGDTAHTPDLVLYGPDSCEYYDNYNMKSTNGWADLLNLMDVLKNNPSQISTILNVDRALWHQAVSMVIPNLDTYNGKYVHNYYLYKQKDGLFHVIPWDANESFGGVMANGTNGEQILEQWSPTYGYVPYSPNRPLVYQLLSNPVYHKQYMAHIRTIMDEGYDTTSLAPQILAMQNLTYAAAVADVNHKFPIADVKKNVRKTIFAWKYWPFISNYSSILGTVTNRKALLLAHAEVAKVPPVISNTTRNIVQPRVGGNIYITAQISNATLVELMSTINQYGSFFTPVQMFDDGLHSDGASGDGVYGGLMPSSYALGDNVKYYIRAQNANAMKLDPQRAEYVFYTYTVAAPVGIKENELLSQIALFPNPSNGSFMLTSEGKPLNSIEIYDVLGKIVYTHAAANETKLEIDLNGMEKGIYFLQIKGVGTKKLVIE